jgi:hypothetical protein
MNKYTLRRFIASIITVPLAYAGYLFIWIILIAFGGEGRFVDFQENLPIIAFAWVLGWTLGPDLERYIERRQVQRD